MKNLPTKLQEMKITEIAIPGSHDSGTYSLSKTDIYVNGLARKSDVLMDFLRSNYTADDDGKLKQLFYQWGKTQDFDISQQLQCGIRYLDLRIAFDKNNNSRIVHGLYGTTLNDIFNQINNFTKYHPKEIVITDIKLVYTNKLKYETAIQLINKQVKTWFNSRAILAEQLKDYVIKEIWNKNISIIIFLHNNLSQKKTMEGGYRMEIKSPFDYNKFTQTSSWLHFLDLNYENRRLRHDKDSRSFYVTQGIMQPHWMEVVVAGISGSASLRVWVSEHATLKITHWLQGKKIGVGGINIVIGDFIESHHFVDSVLQLNIFSNVRQQGASQSKSIREASELKLKSVFYQLVAIFLIFRFFVNYS